MAGVLALVWSLIIPSGASSDSISVTISVAGLLVAVAALTGFIALHEILHALPAMIAGSSDDVVVGFWPRYLTPYMAYTGVLSRQAQLISGVTPFVALTLLPFVVALALPAAAWWMVGLSVLNALGSAADLIMLVILMYQVPRTAVIRSQGIATWWRPADGESPPSDTPSVIV